ncbi:hypothetical protein DPV78_006348 [Talaromyces pinophilus]|nr:hypothetical protein DPV78_006348 [Talaromyces pinophilus]
MRPQSRNEFEIAIICALTLEYDAVEALFDQTYDTSGIAAYGKQPGDANWYRTGRIGTHNVVLTCLNEMGKRNAASVASNLLVSFPRINLGLLVGICGAVPFPSEETEIILGDVIVSEKIVEYDFGRQFPDGFRRKRTVQKTLGGPNRTIRSFLSYLKTNKMHGQLQDDLWQYQQTLQSHHDGRKWQYPGTAQDQLFESLYRHKHYHQHPDTMCLCADCHCSSDPVCEKVLEVDCRKSGCMGSLVPRTRLMADSPKPHVHFGSMASADTVMKSGQHRDEIAVMEKVIGFEMEGAGIWDILPCVIIKGVCDYADSHKNKTWQNYAAATAASCTKAFLGYWTSSVSDRPGTFLMAHIAGKENTYEETLSDSQRKELLSLLRFDQIDARQMSLKAAQGKTCRWMLRNPKYRDWLDYGKSQNHNGFLWIKGKPGAGKSIMMKFLYQQARKNMQGVVVISFFFNARGDALEKSTMGLYRSVLHQLLCKMPDLMPCLDYCGTHRLSAIRNTGWESEMLKEIFALAVDRLRDRGVVCFVDALDECPEDDVRDMISLFEELGARENSCNFLVCFSSRHYPEISIKTGLQLVLEKEKDHGDDIRLYIDSQLKIENTPQSDDIKAEVLRKSSGIFLWVALVVPMLNKEHDRGRTKALKRRLSEIPAGLHDLFVDILTRDCSNVDDLVLCIQFILFAKRPLSPQELQVALLTAFDIQLQDPFNTAEVTGEVLRRFILDVSKGLAEITKSKKPTVQFIHESVRDFLLKEGGINKLPTREKNIEGQSHAIITRVCLLQLRADLDSYRHTYQGYPLAFSQFRTENISSSFPFLEYAVNHILHHSNAAQRLGVPQELLFERLDLDRWIHLYNAFQKHSTNMYSADTHLLYILSTHGAEALIRIHPERSHHLSLRGGRFKVPLLAALYTGNNDAARALLGIDPSEDIHSDEAPQDSPADPPKMRLGNFNASRDLVSYLAEFGDTVILRKVLETGEHKKYEHSRYDGIWRYNPLYYASSEDVVELLAEFAQDIGLFMGFDQNNEASSATITSTVDGASSNTFLSQILKHWPPSIGQSFPEYAAERGFARLASVAVQHAGHDVNEKRPNLFTIAAYGRTNHAGRLAIMKDLHEAHANPGEATLHAAVANPFNDEIIQFLISTCEVNLEHKNYGLTALALAVQEGRKGYVQILLAAGADPRSRLRMGSTMLIHSVKNGNLGILNLLLSDPRCENDAVDNDGRTALSWCVTVGDDTAAKMMSMLLKLGTADLNVRDNQGRTVLERAICGAQPVMVSMLCSSTQPLDLKNSRGKNLLGLVVALCREQNCVQFHEIARLLLASGHFKPRWGKEHRYPLLERCESYGLRELSQMIRTFLEGGDLGPPLMKYTLP